VVRCNVVQCDAARCGLVWCLAWRCMLAFSLAWRGVVSWLMELWRGVTLSRVQSGPVGMRLKKRLRQRRRH